MDDIFEFPAVVCFRKLRAETSRVQRWALQARFGAGKQSSKLENFGVGRQADHLDSLELIDAGCGSGVLALSASALGFQKILGFDFDPEAIVVCRSNSQENPHLAQLDFEVADLEKGLKNRQADLLLANIQTDVLIPHSDPVVFGVKPGGTLALSGILVKELDLVRAHYEARFAELRPEDTITLDSRQDGEWGDLQFVLS